MKKLTAIIMIFVLLLSSSLCAFANDLGLVKALEFCPQSWTNANEEMPATRAELCYMAVCLIGNVNCEAKDTIFDDVTKENAYSGYIQFLNDLGVVGGVSETSFDPNGNVSLAMATKVFLTVLGYGGLASNYGGYPDGYIQAALNLEILNDVYGNEILSRKDLCTMMHNILVSMPNHGISVVNGTLIYESEKTKGILSERDREKFAKEHLMVNYPNAGKSIVNYIKNELNI